MSGVQQVSFTDPYSEQAQDIERRRRLAEALQAQGQTPMGPTEHVGGWAIKKSPWEGVGKLAQSLSGAYQQEQLKGEQKALGERQRADFGLDRAQLAAALQGSPSTMYEDAAGNAAPTDARAPDPKAMQTMEFRSPMFQQAQMQQMVAAMTPKAPLKAGPGDRFLDPTTFKDLGGVAPTPKYHNVGGNLVAEPAQGAAPGAPLKPVYSAPEKDEAAKFNAILTGAGIDPAGPQGQALFKALAMKTATHQPATQVTTNVSTEKKYGEQFAGQIAKADSDMRDSAMKAPQLAERSNQVKKLLAEGKVITGSAADFRLAFAKAAQLAGMGNGTAADTEQVSVALAQNTLDAIKASGLGAGNGFSNADRDFLEKAVGGKITLEKPTLERLADLSHKAASATAQKWNTRVKEIPKTALEGTGIKSDAIEVPGLFAPAAAPKQSDVDAALKKYGG